MARATPLICKWRHWLKRIEREQLQDLLINQHFFHQFRDHTASCHEGRTEHAEFAEWYSGPQKVDHSGHLHLLRLFPFQPP